jgi:hypothetical protein
MSDHARAEGDRNPRPPHPGPEVFAADIDTHPDAPLPPEPLVEAALRAIAPTLADVGQTSELGAGKGAPGQRIVVYDRLLRELAEKRGHSKAAAAWAIHRLAEKGLLVIRSSIGVFPFPVGRDDSRAGQPTEVRRRDLPSSLVQSTPGLWTLWHEQGGNSVNAAAAETADAARGSTSPEKSSETLEQLQDWLAQRVRWIRDWHLAPDESLAPGLVEAIIKLFRANARDFPNDPQKVSRWASMYIGRFSEITAHQAHGRLERLGVFDAPPWPSIDLETNPRALIASLDHLAALLAFVAQRITAARGEHSRSLFPPLLPEDQPLWEELRVAWSRLLECLRDEAGEPLEAATGFHALLSDALTNLGSALRACGLRDGLDYWDRFPPYGSLARNLLPLVHDPSPEAVRRLLAQDAKKPDFLARMRREVHQVAEALLAATRPVPESVLCSGPSSVAQETAVPPTARPTRNSDSARKVLRDRKMEERNRWIYQQCCKRREHDAIVAELKRIAVRRRWRIVSTKQRIQQIGREYARQHDLEPPPARRNL